MIVDGVHIKEEIHGFSQTHTIYPDDLGQRNHGVHKKICFFFDVYHK